MSTHNVSYACFSRIYVRTCVGDLNHSKSSRLSCSIYLPCTNLILHEEKESLVQSYMHSVISDFSICVNGSKMDAVMSQLV